ncbi:MAG: undecaprenyl/decaprenyl-phosphate alpha-N-acetylglucosaminyl 1-phosphate transferase [Crocinitomicaceae bacterium]|nr:undecaprenyl/decaprenyl-phosphate alpha-N-acetylglucosaminyl 1-phosphate transferase [Crocinitomicaceae bacterium]
MTDLIFALLTSFFLVLIATPSLIKVAKLKHLVDEPGEARKLHSRSIPTLGGVMIFAGTIIAYCLWFPAKSNWMGRNYDPLSALNEFKYLVACMFMLFFLGLKDDIIGVSPSKKLLVHMLVGFILVVVANIRLTSFWGLFYVDELPHSVSIGLSVFIYIVIVNAINLIDGVDGLAAGVGLIASVAFAYWFFRTEDQPLALLATGLAGSLLGFLVFNFQPAKIFMGDAGSLIMGVVLYVLTMKMIEFPPNRMITPMAHVSKPVLAMAIMSYPLIDTLRVFLLRTLQGRSPFSADKNHIHHKLLSLGLSHRQTALFLYAFTVFMILLTFLTPAYTPNVSFLLVGSVALLITNSIFWISRKKNKKRITSQEK